MITLYSYPNSRSLRVAWTLEELGLEYACRYVDLAAGGGQGADYLARHPDGKVPALQDGELTLFESAAICRYLAERYGEGRLLPAEPERRAILDQWLFFIVSELEQPLWTQAKHKFALPQERRAPAVIPTAAWEFQRALAALQRGFDGEGWLLGDDFTIADILLGHTLSWAQSAKQPLPAVLEDYRQRCNARPAREEACRREEAAREAGE
ncbi:glutathione S-transferase [Modicisalibacter ilicicola DSM 19980]|uniref:Glutathione S-transferase n=1 Tax=Modicisalibacter ilicicola DSM 19980 TaxID=1121942 RepID=A0A1M5ACJ0_9GAMM|nr:glutathione S-transferase family protein [Halomonas ilicicola]SHF27905.1 glutathione S-transferase [Halomonas ilicicola DSM 19980]